MAKFDLAVLGGGPGGYVAAIRSAQLGLKTCIIDKDKLGGICLNWGCIPTKALLKNAEVYHIIKHAYTYGIKVENVSVDFKKNIQRSRDISNRLSKGIEFLMKKNKITHITGVGKLTSKTSLEVKNKQKIDTIEADKIILATGARPRSFPGMEFDGNRVISFKEAMVLDSPPKKMIIIGSGAIGSEFAYYYNEFGTEVHMIEMLDRILPIEDADVSKEVEKSFKKSNIKISTGTKVSKIESLKTKVKVHTERNGKEEILEGDLALLAVGVTGNIEYLGLEELGQMVVTLPLTNLTKPIFRIFMRLATCQDRLGWHMLHLHRDMLRRIILGAIHPNRWIILIFPAAPIVNRKLAH